MFIFRALSGFGPANLSRAAVVVLCLAGCSSQAATSSPSSQSSSQSSGQSSSNVVASGPCDKASLAVHVGVAAGAVRQFVWKPYASGSFARGAAGRATATAKGGLAGAFAARELSTAIAAVSGCPGATRLVNALHAGVALSRSASRQLKKGTVNSMTLGGTNSIIKTVIDEAKTLGVPVTAKVPTAAQLAAGSV